jgi:leucyl/phenylalanyl-tRNA--protein transferase
MIRIPRLHPDHIAFPAVESALIEPNGLLAYGGDLRSERLLAAYARGIFPWYSQDQPLLWWSPDPRLVIDTAIPHVPRRLRRWLKTCTWTLRADQAFADVMRACAQPRHRDGGTWINDDMVKAYCRLHEQGHAHSIEVWDQADLVGGIYGVAIGRMFFGESMFSRRDHASKVALLGLCRGLAALGFPLLDAQVSSPHLFTLGAREMPRREFSRRLDDLVAQPSIEGDWDRTFARITPKVLGTAGAGPGTPT